MPETPIMSWALAAILLLLLAAGCNNSGATDDGDNDDSGGDTDTDGDADADADADADGDADTDADGDADTDADGDADTDADGDADADADSDCDALSAFCCSEECECLANGTSCVYPEGLGMLGVCKELINTPGECWSVADCEYGEHCDGAIVCPCDYDCLVPDAPGTCAYYTGACCDAGNPTEPCAGDAFCMELGDEDTCHANLELPQCWEDDDCGEGFCEGAMICSCMVDCVSQPGICAY